jgi:hypothetical protein
MPQPPHVRAWSNAAHSTLLVERGQRLGDTAGHDAPITLDLLAFDRESARCFVARRLEGRDLRSDRCTLHVDARDGHFRFLDPLHDDEFLVFEVGEALREGGELGLEARDILD